MRHRVESRFPKGRFLPAASPDHGSRHDRWRVFSALADSRTCAPRSNLGFDHGGEAGDGERIALDTETAHHGARDLRHVGASAKRFTGVNVADVHLDDRRLYDAERVKNCNRRVAISSWIDDQSRHSLGACLLNPADDLALVIGLAKFHFQPVTLRRRAAKLFDVGERRAAVNLRLARAEQIEIGSVEDVNGLWHLADNTRRSFCRGGESPPRQVCVNWQACLPASLFTKPFIGKASAKGKTERLHGVARSALMKPEIGLGGPQGGPQI